MNNFIDAAAFAQLPCRLIDAVKERDGLIYAPLGCTLLFNPTTKPLCDQYCSIAAQFERFQETKSDVDYIRFERRVLALNYTVSGQWYYVNIKPVGSYAEAVASKNVRISLETYRDNRFTTKLLLDDSGGATGFGINHSLDLLDKLKRHVKHKADASELDRPVLYLQAKRQQLKDRMKGAS